jgi:PEP-CTERM motif
MRHTFFSTFAVTSIILASTVVARADTVDNFSFDYGPATLTWSIPVPALPLQVNYYSATFQSPLFLAGETAESPSEIFLSGGQGDGVDLEVFFQLSNGIGLPSTLEFYLAGPQLFTGPLTAPVFLLGTTSLTGQLVTDPGGSHSPNVPGDLTISQESTSPVPEPSTFAMLGTGLAAFAACRRRQFGITQ